MYGGWSGAGASAASGLTGVGVNVVDEAVGHGFLSREPSVAVRVLLDLLKGLTGVLCDELAQHTSQTLEQIEKDSDRDRWFTAEEAMAYGFVDHVYTHSGQAAGGAGTRA